MVEDDAAIRVNVCDCLQHLGYTVLEAASGESALEICDKQGKVDLMMTDLVMPGMSGRETAARALASLSRNSSACTPPATQRMARHAANCCRTARSFLEKPYTVADLARAVRRALFARPQAKSGAEASAPRM